MFCIPFLRKWYKTISDSMIWLWIILCNMVRAWNGSWFILIYILSSDSIKRNIISSFLEYFIHRFIKICVNPYHKAWCYILSRFLKYIHVLIYVNDNVTQLDIILSKEISYHIISFCDLTYHVQWCHSISSQFQPYHMIIYCSISYFTKWYDSILHVIIYQYVISNHLFWNGLLVYKVVDTLCFQTIWFTNPMPPYWVILLVTVNRVIIWPLLIVEFRIVWTIQ